MSAVPTVDRVLRVRARLTERDLLLLDWLADHQVLTTDQIAHALFSSLGFAQRRLLDLHRLRLLERFRPLRAGGGSYPWHHVLGHLGALFVAAAREQPAPRPAASLERIRRLAASRNLDHQLAVNRFFTDLAGHARGTGSGRLERWWSERQCAQPGAFGAGLISPVRPDGHGIWTENGRRVAFFLEMDRGTESHRQLVEKLGRYNQHVARGGPVWPVLFWLPSLPREAALHATLTELRSGSGLSLPIATAVQILDGASPADAVWLIHGAGDQPRRLIDLERRGWPPSADEGPCGQAHGKPRVP
jgi:hypothetical protein